MSQYDVVIVGAGPNGLAMLSRLHESSKSASFRLHGNQTYESEKNEQTCPLKVAVVDACGSWLSQWQRGFSQLEIDHLRSPMAAQPDFQDEFALSSFVQSSGQSGSVRKADLFAKTRTEDWNFQLSKPSNTSFQAFCLNLAKDLPHDFVTGRVEDIYKDEENAEGQTPLTVVLEDGQTLETKAVVLAQGYGGRPNIPPKFQNGGCIHSSTFSASRVRPGMRILVVGGGSSAAQSALLAAKYGASKTVLLSRRHLAVQPFELTSEWMEPGESGRLRFEFYSKKPKERLRFIKEHRRSSVSVDDFKRLQESNVIRRVGQVKKLVHNSKDGTVDVVLDNQHQTFDLVVVATGFQTDCTRNALVQNLQSRYKIPMTGGFPILQPNLRWRADLNVFCLGALAAISEGPEAFSMMGMRRCVSLVGSQIKPTPKAIQNNAYDLLYRKKDKRKKQK